MKKYEGVSGKFEKYKENMKEYDGTYRKYEGI